MIFVQDSLGAQEADTVQHVISAAGAPQDTLGSRVDLQAVSETVTGAEGMPIPYSPRTDDGLAMILLYFRLKGVEKHKEFNGGGSCAHENNTGMYRMQES